MPTFEDLDGLARAMPEADARLSTTGRPDYSVKGKSFLLLRPPRKDAIDPDTGEPMDDVLVFRTQGQAGKSRWLDDPTLPLFTTPHFDGWPAVLMRVRHLDAADAASLRELVTHAWAAQAPKALVKAYLARRDAVDPHSERES